MCEKLTVFLYSFSKKEVTKHGKTLNRSELESDRIRFHYIKKPSV